MVSPTVKWTAKSVSNSNGVTTQMAMWKHIAIFIEEIYADRMESRILQEIFHDFISALFFDLFQISYDSLFKAWKQA